MDNLAATKPDTIRTRRWQDTFESIIVNIIAVLLFIAFGYIAVMSIFQTSVIDPDNYVNEVILYQPDNAMLSVALTALFFIIVMGMRRYYSFFSRVNLVAMEIGLLVYVLVLGMLWVNAVQSIPGADSANIFEAASGAAQGDYTGLQSNALFHNHDYYQNNSYFMFYPFQLGFVFICELIYRVFGAATAMPLEYINVICVALAYLGIAKVTRELFSRRAAEFVAIVLLIGCLQPILFTTFAYGNVMGMCFAIWACYFLIRYFRTARYLLLIPSGVLLVLSTLAKYNNMIYLVAFAVVLIVHAIKEKKWQSIAFLLILCVCTVGASKLIIKSYEQRADTTYTNGVSQVLYMDTGLQESYMAPGWYTTIGMRTFMDNNFDTDAANEQAWEDIKERLEQFSDDPAYAVDFFSKKILSQWNEPTYESIWVSKVKGHYNGEVGAFVNSVYNKSWGQFLGSYFNGYVQVLFVLFAGGIMTLFIKRRTDISTILLPLVLLGGFGYHLLFEGKSQYILTYIILLIPIAAFAAVSMMESRANIFAFIGDEPASYKPDEPGEPEESDEPKAAAELPTQAEDTADLPDAAAPIDADETMEDEG